MSEKQELLEKLRIAKETKGLSYQDIVDITEENGEAVSLSTVKRIFQKDSDLDDFRYHQTVRPVIRAVLGMDEETEKPAAEPTAEQAEQYYATIEGLKAVVDLKHEQLMALQRENDRLTAEMSDLKVDRKEDIKRHDEESQKKVDYLKRIVDDLQQSIKWYKGSLKWHKRVIVVLGLVCIAVLAALIIDLAIGDIGWIRY